MDGSEYESQCNNGVWDAQCRNGRCRNWMRPSGYAYYPEWYTGYDCPNPPAGWLPVEPTETLGPTIVEPMATDWTTPEPTTSSLPTPVTPCEIVEKIIKSWQEDPDKDMSCLPRWTRNYSDCMFALNIRKPLCT